MAQGIVRMTWGCSRGLVWCSAYCDAGRHYARNSKGCLAGYPITLQKGKVIGYAIQDLTKKGFGCKVVGVAVGSA